MAEGTLSLLPACGSRGLRASLPVGARCRAPSFPRGGTRREGRHPDGWGLRGRGPAGRCADREVGVPWPAPRFFSNGGTRSRGFAGRGGGQRHRRWFRAPARCRSEAPTGRTGQRSKPSPRFFTIGGTRFPLSRAILPLGGTRREGRHPEGWGLRGRGPAGRCAGPHREDWPEVGVPWPAPRFFSMAVRGLAALRAAVAVSVIGAGFALPRDAGRRPALLFPRFRC